MSRCSRQVLALAIGFCALFMAAGALANEKAESRKHFKAGTALMKAEDFSGASAEFKASIDLYPTKNGFYNLAGCYKALHRYGEALDVLDRMQEVLGAKLNRTMKKKVEALSLEIQTLVATLTIQVTQAGAAVAIDGRGVGTSPLPKPYLVGPGEHSIQVSLDGHETIERTVSLISGKTTVESFQLELLRAELMVSTNVSSVVIVVDGILVGETPLAEPLSLEPGSHAVELTHDGYESISREIQVTGGDKRTLDFTLVEKAPEVVIVPEPVEPQPAPQPAPQPFAPAEEGKKSKLSPLFWVGFAGTLVVGAGAGVFFGLTSVKKSDFNNYDEKYSDPDLEEQSTIDDYDDKRQTAKTDAELNNKLAIGLGIGAGALAISTIIIMAVDLSSDESEGVAIAPAPGGVSVRF